MSAVSLERICCKFGDVVAVDEINLHVEHGEFVTLLGPSGCGKTTTLRMIAGLEQNTAGRIRIGDRVVSDGEANYFLPPNRRHLGMVFQSYAIWPHMTVFENVAYPLRVRRRSKGEIEQRVQSALALVEMGHLAQRPAPALSGGQQQRVAIARALVFEPEVLLLDEPLSNLDAKLRLQMGDEFRSLQKRLGITSIYVTHDQEEAMALSDRVVVMHQGKILQIGAPEEIYHRPNCKAVAAFLGAPNLIDVRVRSVSEEPDGIFSMSVEGPGWTMQARSAESCREGDVAVLVIRPENISVGAATEGANGVWRGRVVHSLFRGSHRSIEVQTESERFNVQIAATAEPRVGDAVSLSASSAWLVRA